MLKIDSAVYKLFLGGVLVGVVSALLIVAFFLKQDNVSEQEKNDQQTQKLPQFGESGYDPEKLGYLSLIGTVKTISPKEIVFISSWCLKPGCDATKDHSYRATITKETVLKRLIRKDRVESTQNALPNPYREEQLLLSSVKPEEDVTALVKEIINDTSFIAHEISIFEPFTLTP